MDLIDFEPTEMYFDAAIHPRVEALIEGAGALYGQPEAEAKLLEAETLAPEHLTVLVALYRYYFYSHRLSAALNVASKALEVCARRLDFPRAWRDVSAPDIERAGTQQPELMRFYLHTLKGAGYLELRLGLVDKGLSRLDHVASLDPKDRLGAQALADVARAYAGEHFDRADGVQPQAAH